MPTVKYEWRDGSRIHIDPQAAGRHLTHLHRRHGGLTARVVVDDAESQTSPLHEAFEWNDAVAADEYRKEQARLMLRSIVRIRQSPSGEPERFRAFITIAEDDDGPVYTSIARVMGDKGLREQVLRRAWRELESWRERYQEYEELAAVFAAIDEERERKAS